MEMLEFIKSRRSTRRYAEKAVEKEKVEAVVEAGRYAPSGGNSQTTHFLVIRNKEILTELASLVQSEFAKMEVTPGMYRSKANSINASHTGRYVFHYNAPVVVITANRIDYGNSMADCCCALENMLLEANALDLGTCYLNQLNWLGDNPVIVEYLRKLGLAENERVFASIALGYPATDDGLPLRNPQVRTGNPVTYID